VGEGGTSFGDGEAHPSFVVARGDGGWWSGHGWTLRVRRVRLAPNRAVERSSTRSDVSAVRTLSR
jgi:hypothetical protein